MDKSKWQELKPNILFCFFIVVLMFLASFILDRQLPADVKIPVHWNIKGEVDRYGSKIEGLYMLPGLTVVMVLLFTLIPMIEPRRKHLQFSMKAYKLIVSSIIVFMAVIHAIILISVKGAAPDVGRLVNLGVGVLFMILGNYLGKIRSNFFIGIRSPWTLSSEVSWYKTHRLGGWLFFILGLITLINVIFWNSKRAFIILITGVLICAIVPTIYSYFVWKSDPNKKSRF